MTNTDLNYLLAIARANELSLSSLHSLSYLHHLHVAPISKVAHHIGITPAAMTRIADGLTHRRLVNRRADTDDRRQICLEISPKGSSLMASILLGAERGSPSFTPLPIPRSGGISLAKLA